MTLVLFLQLLTLWPLCDADIMSTVPPASHPKPRLGAQPAAIVTPGVNVTLSCRAPQPAWRFALFKSGEVISVLHWEVSKELADFFLEEVTPAQGGSYHCQYQMAGWDLGVWSHPSDTLELLVTGEVLGQGKRRDIGAPPPAALPAGSGPSDYTQGNLVRLGLAGLVLVSLGLLVCLDWRSRTRIPCRARL
ncbi:osteoclast-associated immunoglobulin-like receptor [Crocuta crocuta]